MEKFQLNDSLPVICLQITEKHSGKSCIQQILSPDISLLSQTANDWYLPNESKQLPAQGIGWTQVTNKYVKNRAFSQSLGGGKSWFCQVAQL